VYDVNKNRQKWRIRHNALSKYSYLSKDKILEVFAGWGNMTKYWSQIAGQVISNEKDLSKLGFVLPENVKTLNLDYRDNHIIELCKNIEIIDCDAFGLIMDYVKELCEMSNTNKLIFFTDGIKKRSKVLKKINIEKYFNNYNYDDIYYEQCTMGNVFYGYIFKRKIYEL